MNLSRFDLTTLALFIAVAREGSISAGARASHLATGAASKRISDLEAALGTPLLFRHSGGVKLTDAGAACLHHAERVVQEIEQMSVSLSDFQQGIRGEVRLAANTSAITQFLAEDLASFMRAHPAIRIHLKEDNSHTIVKAVIDKQADLGIFADRTAADGLHTFLYKADNLVLIVPPRHPLERRAQIDFSETLDYDYIGLTPSTSLAMRLQEESDRLGKPIRLRIQVRGFDSICRLALATHCIGILPRLAVAPYSHSMQLSLVSLNDDWARRSLMIGVRDTDTLPVPARLLLAHLRQAHQPA